MKDTIKVWTDGACNPNPGKGGWGWHDSNGNFDIGGKSYTTNNQMEMTAILEALKTYPDGTKLMVYSDSQYCVKGLTIWRNGWKRNNWCRKGEAMPNRDLWLALESQLNRLKVKFTWVKGHDGDPGNEKADELARMGRSGFNPTKEDRPHVHVRPPAKSALEEEIERLQKSIKLLENAVLEIMLP